MLNTPAKFYTIWFAQMGARKIKKIDFPPFLHILLHMVDFMSYYKFILCIINVLHKLKYCMR